MKNTDQLNSIKAEIFDRLLIIEEYSNQEANLRKKFETDVLSLQKKYDLENLQQKIISLNKERLELEEK